MKNYTHNATFRRICGALLLKRGDVVAICKLGGVEISASLADGWRRGPKTYRKPDPGSQDPGDLARRDKPISDEQWAAFWRGLDLWLHRNAD